LKIPILVPCNLIDLLLNNNNKILSDIMDKTRTKLTIDNVNYIYNK